MSVSVDVGASPGRVAARAPSAAIKRVGYYRYIKRLIDILVVISTAPLTVPAIVLLAMLISMDGGHPFYHQPRVGRNGKTFKFWKLRSMVLDADAKLKSYLDSNEAAKAEWDFSQKLREDPRVTRIGFFIRKVSLDELPQLWNILKGDMTLVGPRPMLPEQVPLYPGRAYFAMTPGLTGFWQIADRNNTSFASRADYDNAYAEAMSLSVDLKVIYRTVGVVWGGTGL